MSKILRMVVISPELIVVLVCGNVVVRYPSVGREVAAVVLQKELIQYCVLGAPFAGLYFAYKTAGHLLDPPQASDTDLYKWADYRFLRYHVYCTFAFCIIGIVASVLMLFLHKWVGLSVLGNVYGTATCTWFVSLITLGMARLRVNAILGGER